MASLEEVNLHLKSGLIRIMVFVGSGLIRGKPGEDPGFQVGGGAHLKKLCRVEGGISYEKSRFYAKKSYFFQF
jgi:hypothetical protein